MKKILKKNQVIIYVIALMLVAAGYLNFTTNTEQASVETSMQMESNDDTQVADIGDATLVSSNDIVANNNTNLENSTTEANKIDNTSNTDARDTNNTVDTSSVSNNSNDYFVKSKLERDTMYSQMLETYENVLNSNNALETQKQSATEEIKKINNTKNSIMVCENLITTKGFDKNVVFVNGDSISVIIGKKDALKQEEVAQIQNIIARELNAKIENIHISQK